jgi:hypothetical protein
LYEKAVFFSLEGKRAKKGNPCPSAAHLAAHQGPPVTNDDLLSITRKYRNAKFP